MTTSDLTKAIFFRLKKFKYFILLVAILAAAALALYARSSPVTFTSKATVFPLSSGAESSTTSSLASVLLGTNESSKSFSDDASISIVEIALSRRTRESVAAIQVPDFGNKTVAQILLEDYNSHRSTFEKVITFKSNEQLMNWSESVMKDGLLASINKNNILELHYSGRSEPVVKLVSNYFIDKISQFYIDLKREKAMRDYQFASSKVDSLRRVMGAKDYMLIGLDKRLLFTNTNKLQFRVPTENLLAEKQLIRNQYTQAVGNQQNAAYKLQKATPLIEVLDKPNPPYDSQKKSTAMYGMVGFILGSVLIIMLLISGILRTFIKHELNKVLFGLSGSKTTTTTTATAL